MDGRWKRRSRPGAACSETAGNGGQTPTVEVLAQETVDDWIGGAVAVAEKLEDGEEDASDGATMGATVPQ